MLEQRYNQPQGILREGDSRESMRNSLGRERTVKRLRHTPRKASKFPTTHKLRKVRGTRRLRGNVSPTLLPSLCSSLGQPSYPAWIRAPWTWLVNVPRSWINGENRGHSLWLKSSNLVIIMYFKKNVLGSVCIVLENKNLGFCLQSNGTNFLVITYFMY